MVHFPDTQQSLILRLRDRDDAKAWEQFAILYQPVVYRLARAKGMQDADAQELVQETMLAVSKAVDRWTPNPEQGRFRNWLSTIARNLIINYLTRPRHRTTAIGDTEAWDQLHAIPSQDYANWLQSYDWEYRRELFRHVSEIVRHEFHASTWQAFWQTSVDGLPAHAVSQRLGISIGSVYIARSRVMARLQRALEDHTQ